jgi:hypothetical protein
MDIEDRGPVLAAGRFALRVSNVGVLGNPWFDVGRSFDPSFEYPRGSGHELLGRAELWVGGIGADGHRRVSGGPMYEWRPTLDPADRVHTANAGAPGSRWSFDDDGDGRVDEDPLNGRDDDGDGRVDEDFDLPSQEMMTSDYTDDKPEAVNYGYPLGEQHVPLGLAVHQETFAWAEAGADNIAGVHFVITNISPLPLHDLRLGLYADLDSRAASDRGGHLDDEVSRVRYEVILPSPDAVVNVGSSPWRKHCYARFAGEAVAIHDSRPSSGLPCGAVVPLSHTTDPLGLLTNDAFPGAAAARAASRAPTADTTFRTYVFAQDLAPGQGGPPVLDEDRWTALAGLFRTAPENQKHDYAVLVSCGPFPHLEPGQSVEFSVALVAAGVLDSLAPAAFQARVLQRGTGYNAQVDSLSAQWFQGYSGINGHEVCVEPPPGMTFDYEPNCPEKFYQDPYLIPEGAPFGPEVAFQIPYEPGHCVWTDADCNACTGLGGIDLWHHWSISSPLPSPPAIRVTPGDHEAVIEWDDSPEAALAAGLVRDAHWSFAGYKLYRLDDWTRASLLPPPDRWQRLAVYRPDTALGGRSLAAITDSSLGVDGTVNGAPKHPVGRYRVVDHGLIDGADYNYVVTSIVHAHAPLDTLPAIVAEQESPFSPDYSQRITPHTASRPGAPGAWVVPNPYRGKSTWERPPVPGDTFTRHLDFMGLPRERCVIRVYTVAGDLVASIDHDGSNGDGQAPWNLITRNGQDVASGLYLFTVDGPSGHQVGRFVIMR